MLWRSLPAAPFALALVLTLALDPVTSASMHGSVTGLAVLSLAATASMSAVRNGRFPERSSPDRLALSLWRRAQCL